jgi:hypothetical protein
LTSNVSLKFYKKAYAQINRMSGFPMMPNMQGMPPVAANPAPPKILTPPIPPYVADYIAKEAARQIAVITGVTGATGPSS